MAKSIVQFLQEVRAELNKVEWPNTQEFVGSTIVVLVLVCFFMILLFIMDMGIARVTQYIFSRYSGGY